MRAAALIVLSAALGLAGCASHVPAHPHPHPAPRVVVIAKGHHHTRSCGHYFHAGRWYYVRGHVHHRGCGHLHVAGVWRIR